VNYQQFGVFVNDGQEFHVAGHCEPVKPLRLTLPAEFGALSQHDRSKDGGAEKSPAGTLMIALVFFPRGQSFCRKSSAAILIHLVRLRNSPGRF
jgi:hypothetical protein